MTTQTGLCAVVLALTCGFAEVRTVAAQDRPNPWVPTVGAPQYFAVLVADAEKSAQWYRTAFGLRELDRSAATDSSWQIVNLVSDHLLVEIIRDNRAPRGNRDAGFVKVGFNVPDVAAVADGVGRATGTRPRVLDFPRQGVRIVQLFDPDGNTIQLSSRLSPPPAQ